MTSMYDSPLKKFTKQAQEEIPYVHGKGSLITQMRKTRVAELMRDAGLDLLEEHRRDYRG